MHRFYLVLVVFCCFGLGVLSNPVCGQEDSGELIKMVVEFLNESDRDMRALALEQIRNEARGAEATKQFASQLPKLDDQTKIGLLRALGDRGDAAAKDAVIGTLRSTENPEVKKAAIRALGQLGDASDVKLLVDALSDSLTRTTARQSLVQLRGRDVNQEIVRQIEQNDARGTKVALIEILGERRAIDALLFLSKLSVGDDSAIRVAAMKVLGALGGPEQISIMAYSLLMANSPSERANAERAIMFVCNRIPEKDERAVPLLKVMKLLTPAEKAKILPTLGRVGGKDALREIELAIASRDPTMHAAGIRAIANWPDASVAERLMQLTKTDKHTDHRRIARMALIRIAPIPDGRSDVEKLELLRKAMSMAKTDSERIYALKRAAAIRLPETLEFVKPYLGSSKFAQQACLTIVELAHHRELRDNNKKAFHAALDDVIRIAKDPVVVDRAQRYKKGQTWVRPK